MKETEDIEMLSIAILDDNINVLEEYEQLIPIWLGRNEINGQIVTATTDYREFVKAVQDNSVNVCIIDINLQSEVNGIYVAKYIRKKNINTEIIFCTGMLEFMHQAFDVNAYHFIVKPFGRNLERCLIKLDREIASRQKVKGILEVKTRSHIYYLSHESISHILRIGAKTVIHSTDNVIEVYESVESIVSKLDSNKFIRCHRSTVVNKDYIKYIDKKSHTIVLTNGYSSKIGTSFYPVS
jgi:DNA-binding LytR/AlgR family response regulator